MALVFGMVTTFVVSIISNYNILNWQWWMTILSIDASGVIYANIKR